MTKHKLYLGALAVICCSVVAWGQEGKVIEHTAVKPTSAASGKDMYMSYCAVCHGKDGKGGGPAADALKVPPIDLTMLSQKNGGKFPAAHVATTLRGEGSVGAHGSKDMPVWGPIFRQMGQGNAGLYDLRIANLTKFVESLQAK